jgi:hypothetical protein
MQGPEGPAGPQGIIAIEAVNGNQTQAISRSGPDLLSPYVTVTSTGTERATGVIESRVTVGGINVWGFGHCLCSRANGTTDIPACFSDSGMGGNTIENNTSFTTADSTVLDVGTWDVGYCVSGSGAVESISSKFAGWLMITK